MLRKRNITPETMALMLSDTGLLWRTKGILAYLATDAEDVPTLEDLADMSADGVKAIRTALSDAEENGYLIRERMRAEHGMLAGACWTLEFGQEQ